MTKTVCQEADEVVGGDRRAAYGPVTKSLSRTAKIWSAILDTEVTPAQVALCLTGLKVARECNSHKRDNLVDFCGYARVLELYYEETADLKPCNDPRFNLSDIPTKPLSPEEVKAMNRMVNGETVIREEPKLSALDRAAIEARTNALLKTLGK